MIYDCFTYNGEKDILDIRFNILDQYVDKFVICESTQTFSGNKKPIYYNLNNPKVIHIIYPEVFNVNAFERAGLQKDFIRTALKNCSPEDVIYYGDVDEIWKPQTSEGKLKQLNYSYYLNNRSSEEWQGTNVFKYKNIRNLNDMRADHSVVLENGGWHFTNMGGIDEIKRKLESYDHQENNTEDIKEDLEWNIKNGFDYVNRGVDWKGKPFEFWIDETELPEYVIINRQKYAKLFK